MRNYKLYIIAIIVLSIVYSCKRYPEDSKYSFRTVKNRLKGNYRLDAYIVNGIDSVHYLQPCFDAGLEKIQGAKNDGKYYYKIVIEYKTMDLRGLDGKGSFSLNGNKSQFSLGYGLYSPNTFSNTYKNILYPCNSCNEEGVWDIMKLTKHEFWIKNMIGNNEYEIHLTKL